MIPPPRRRGGSRRHGGKGGAESRATVQQREDDVMASMDRASSQRQIAKQLGISQPAVSKIVSRVAARHRAQNVQAFERYVFAAERKYESLFRKALDGWDRSCQQRTRRTQRRRAGADAGDGMTAEIQIADSSGDPRFLDQAHKCLERLELIQGITAVVRNGRPDLRPSEPQPPDMPRLVDRLMEKLDRIRERNAQIAAEKASQSATTT